MSGVYKLWLPHNQTIKAIIIHFATATQLHTEELFETVEIVTVNHRSIIPPVIPLMINVISIDFILLG